MTSPSHVMALLAGGIPLSLLLDLADPAGPDSAAIARHEAGIDVVLEALISVPDAPASATAVA